MKKCSFSCDRQNEFGTTNVTFLISNRHMFMFWSEIFSMSNTTSCFHVGNSVASDEVILIRDVPLSSVLLSGIYWLATSNVNVFRLCPTPSVVINSLWFRDYRNKSHASNSMNQYCIWAHMKIGRSINTFFI